MANTIVNNNKARFDYIIIDDYEAGISLKGWEVKSLRAGRGNIKESYATIKDSELLLIGAHISPLLNSNVTDESESTRTSQRGVSPPKGIESTRFMGSRKLSREKATSCQKRRRHT